MGRYIDVVDTAILCGLDIKQSTLDKAEVQARCPYCNDYKYRMYLSRNPDNPTFFCHNCGHRGNAVILFADFNPMLQPMTTQEAYRCLINNPNIHTQANPYFYSPPSFRIRPLWERNIIYMEFKAVEIRARSSGESSPARYVGCDHHRELIQKLPG